VAEQELDRPERGGDRLAIEGFGLDPDTKAAGQSWWLAKPVATPVARSKLSQPVRRIGAAASETMDMERCMNGSPAEVRENPIERPDFLSPGSKSGAPIPVFRRRYSPGVSSGSCLSCGSRVPD